MTQEVLGKLENPLIITSETIDFRSAVTEPIRAPIDFSRMYDAAIQMMLEPPNHSDDYLH